MLPCRTAVDSNLTEAQDLGKLAGGKQNKPGGGGGIAGFASSFIPGHGSGGSGGHGGGISGFAGQFVGNLVNKPKPNQQQAGAQGQQQQQHHGGLGGLASGFVHGHHGQVRVIYSFQPLVANTRRAAAAAR